MDGHKLRLEKLLAREGTGISWASMTFNAWLGCEKVSPACDGCYAESFVEGRLGHMGVKWGGPRRRTAPGNWAKPLRWNAIAQAADVTLNVFCASLSDWADNKVPDEWRRDLGELILRTPNLIWMLLTKRIGNADRMLRDMFPGGVPGNVALGITVPNQHEADRDIRKAIKVKVEHGIARLFLSMEPLLGPVLIAPEWLAFIDLVIVGGESGKDARAMHPGWAIWLRDQCLEAGVSFHFKQWGEWMPVTRLAIPNPSGGPAVTQRIASCTTLGRTFKGDKIFHFDDDQPMVRVGTRAAGHMLLGNEYRGHFSC